MSARIRATRLAIAVAGAVLVAVTLPASPVSATADAPAAAAAPMAARPVPEPVTVSMTDAGYDPAVVTVSVNQTVRFTNEATTAQSVGATDATFDSGTIPAGGGFTMALGAPGTFALRSSGNPAAVGAVTVGLLDLPGEPDATVATSLPTIVGPPPFDLDDHPTLAVVTSRTRAVVLFTPQATVADANAALATAGVTVIGTIPDLGAVTVQAADDGPGQFGPIDAAIDVLRSQPGVDAAFHDRAAGEDAIPAAADEGVRADPLAWSWFDPRLQSTDAPITPAGEGGNWGMEASRFPEAWNLLDQVRMRDADVQTLVHDAGFVAHPDLPIDIVSLCGLAVVGCTGNAAAADHGTHVAGTVGARYDNPGTTAGRTLGVSGGNPVADLSGVGWGGSFPEFERLLTGSVGPGYSTSGAWSLWARILKEKAPGSRFPDLRVVNYSATSVRFSRYTTGQLAWSTKWAGRSCGPGNNDDATGTGPCTPNTEDQFLRDVADEGKLARTFAQDASRKDVLIVAAAGNYSDSICANATTVVPTTGAPPTCPAGSAYVKLDSRAVYAFGWAENHWNDSSANPVIMVGAVNQANGRSSFSNVGGDVSGPGSDILSTIPGGTYATKSGTSMATPHVTALAGYLLAYDPSLSVGALRAAIVGSARNDTPDGVGPRIDAYAALLRLDHAERDLADLSDGSFDGNRRVTRAKSGTMAPDTTTGSTVDGHVLASAPDGHVDMRDFRRFRDAWLEWCTIGPTGTAGCPSPATIDLDGAPNHPKKDLNQDGCVFGADAGCQPTEQHYSRFDLNGDGFLDPLRLADIQIGASSPASRGDLDVLKDSFEPSGGWTKDNLGRLLRSGDLEVHADALFAAGATNVAIDVTYGSAGTHLPATIDRAGGTAIVTVPTEDAGSDVELIGRATIDGATVESGIEVANLKHGSDRRIDLCIPTVEVSAANGTLWTGGKATPVYAKVQHCNAAPKEAEHVDFRLEKEAGVLLSSLSADEADTDASGRATVDLTSGADTEAVTVVAEITIEGQPDTPPQVITGRLPIAVDHAPRLLYRWEQVTDDWHLTTHTLESDTGPEYGKPLTFEYSPAGPTIAQRTGSLTPYPGGADGRSGVTISETVGPTAIPYQFTSNRTGSESGSGVKAVPLANDEIRDEQLTDRLAVDYYDVHGVPLDDTVLANTWFDVGDGRVTVHNLSDVSAARYDYTEDPDQICGPGRPSCGHSLWDQLALGERDNGSAFAFAPDLGRTPTFTRSDDGSWSSYRWCSQPQTYDFTPSDILGPLYNQSGSATSRFRLVATITTDPDATADDLELPTNCADPEPPISAIGRDFVTAKEGHVVRFVDASSDPNNDVTAWHWDLGDGTTSDEQFVDHRYADNGTYHVTLTVTDETGLTDTSAIDVSVDNVVPEVSADTTTVASGTAATVPLRLFDPGERDQEALALDMTWNEPGMPIYPTNTMAGGAYGLALGVLADGVHHLTLTLKDKDGGTATTTVTVTVGGEVTGTVDPDIDSETEPAPGCDYGVKLDQGEQDFVDLVSGYRVDNGRKAVYPSPTLTKAAEDHAAWLRDNDLFQHAGEGGSTPVDRATAAGYPSAAVGENLVMGTRTARDSLVAWKVSDPHNENMLRVPWRAIGIAKVDTVHGPLWVTVYGDVVDCPALPPDLETPSEDPPDPVIPPPTTPPVVVASWHDGIDTGAVTTAGTIDVSVDPVTSVPDPATSVVDPAAAGTFAGSPPPTDPVAAGFGATPITAVTVSTTTPSTGEAVTITNRSTTAVVLDPGDGAPTVPVGPSATVDAVYLDPGSFTLTASSDGRIAGLELVVGGAGRPPEISAIGPAGGAGGRRVTLTATITAGATPIAGRAVTFTVGGHTFEAMTGPDGVAATDYLIDVAPGSYVLTVAVPAVAGGSGATATAPFVVAANQSPVVDLAGPYDVLVGSPIVPDFTATFDPDGLPLLNARWDLDGDGVFGDATGFGPIDAATVTDLVCGGACVPGTDETIRVRVYDNSLAETDGSVLVRFHRDFVIAATPDAATLNPGGSISFQVGVLSTSGFADPVSLSVPALPAGVTASFSPPTVTPNGFSILTLTAATGAAGAPDAPFVIRGTSGALTHDATSVVSVEFGLIPACLATVDLHVTDVETGAPVVGATVENHPGYATDADGVAHLTTVAVGPGNAPRLTGFRVLHPDYWPGTGDGLAACGAPNRIDITMRATQHGSVVGHVVVATPDPLDHSSQRALTLTTTPIPDAAVSFTYLHTTTSDGGGAYALDDIPMAFGTNAPVLGALQVTHEPDYWFEAPEVTVHPGATETVDVGLVPKCYGKVDVRVLDDATQLPVAGASVRIDYSGGVATGTTGPDGRALLPQVLLGTRNAAVDRQVQVQADIGGRTLTASRYVRINDCGSTAVTDVGLHAPVARRASTSGRVTDADTGLPIVDAAVSNGYGFTRTDDHGDYLIPDVIIGYDTTTTATATLSVNPPADAWLAHTASITLQDGQTTVHDVALEPRQFGTLEVTTRDALTDEPLPGVSVLGPGNQPLLSDGDGSVRFDQVRTENVPTTADVSGSLAGYWSSFTTAPIIPGATTTAELKLLRKCAPATISGRVVNALTGEPLPDTYVARPGPVYVFTDAAGLFELGNIPLNNNQPFSITLTAAKSGFLTATKTVTVYCGARLTVDFGTPDTGTASLSGVVTDAATGAPVVGALVGSEWGATTTTGADGSYAFAAVPMGGEPDAKTWRIDALPVAGSGLLDGHESVTVHPDTAATLDIELGSPTNRRPVGQPQSITVASTVDFVPITVVATDPDGDPLTYRYFSLVGARFGATDPGGSLNLYLDAGVTDARFSFVASDGALDSVPVDVVITRGIPPTTTTTTTSPSTTTTTTAPPTTTTTTSPSTTTTTTTAPTTTTTTTAPTTTTTTAPSTTTTTTTAPPSTTTTTTAPVSTTTTTPPVSEPPTSTTTSTSSSSTTSTTTATSMPAVDPTTTDPGSTTTTVGGTTDPNAPVPPAGGSDRGAVGIEATTTGQGALPRTGSSPTLPIVLALASLGLGAGLLLVRRRIRR